MKIINKEIKIFISMFIIVLISFHMSENIGFCKIIKNQKGKGGGDLSKIKKTDKYFTNISPNGKLTIVRKPSLYNPEIVKIDSLPIYDLNAQNLFHYLDMSNCDLSDLDLKNRIKDLRLTSFSARTIWSKNLPKEFSPQRIIKIGKTPGLNIKKLHRQGITGKNIGIAVIDTSILVDHVEFKDQLKLYEEIHWNENNAKNHGTAISSILVGKNIGIAPQADLYFIAVKNNNDKSKEYVPFLKRSWDLTYVAQAIDRLIEINKTLPKNKKIRVVSFSLDVHPKMKGYKLVLEKMKKAEKHNIYFIHVGITNIGLLYRDPLKNPDKINSYDLQIRLQNNKLTKHVPHILKTNIFVPTTRVLAAPTGINDYDFSAIGGASWAVPFVAGLYVLACQVKPDIDPRLFEKYMFKTAYTVTRSFKNKKVKFKIVNPVGLINALKRTAYKNIIKKL